MVKGDGSAMARYPDDAMAVSVNSSVSGGRVVYSMMAMYRNSGKGQSAVAVGVVQGTRYHQPRRGKLS